MANQYRNSPALSHCSSHPHLQPAAYQTSITAAAVAISGWQRDIRDVTDDWTSSYSRLTIAWSARCCFALINQRQQACSVR